MCLRIKLILQELSWYTHEMEEEIEIYSLNKDEAETSITHGLKMAMIL